MDKLVDKYVVTVHCEVLVEIDRRALTCELLDKIKETLPFIDNGIDLAKHIAVEKVRNEDADYPVEFADDTVRYEAEIIDTWSSVETVSENVDGELEGYAEESEVYWPLSQVCMDCQFGDLDLSSHIDMVYLCSKGKSPEVSGICNHKKEVSDDDSES